MKQTTLNTIVLVVLLHTSCQTQDEQETSASATQHEHPISVSIDSLSYHNQESDLTLSGDLEASQTLHVGFLIPGKVLSVFAKEGQKVSKGQLLASLDPQDLQYQVDLSKASLSQTQDLYKRMQEMRKTQNIAEKDFVDIETRLNMANIQLQQAEKRIRDSHLYASIAGIVAAKNIEPGSIVNPGVPAYTIVATQPIHAKIAVPEFHLKNVPLKKSMTIMVPALEEQESGQVVLINPLADPLTKTYAAKIELANRSGKLLPGMSATTTLTSNTNRGQILLIHPQAILHSSNGDPYVLVVDKLRKVANKRSIKTGGFIRDQIEVTEGLQAGEWIVTAGNQKMKDGQSILF